MPALYRVEIDVKSLDNVWQRRLVIKTLSRIHVPIHAPQNAACGLHGQGEQDNLRLSKPMPEPCRVGKTGSFLIFGNKGSSPSMFADPNDKFLFTRVQLGRIRIKGRGHDPAPCSPGLEHRSGRIPPAQTLGRHPKRHLFHIGHAPHGRAQATERPCVPDIGVFPRMKSRNLICRQTLAPNVRRKPPSAVPSFTYCWIRQLPTPIPGVAISRKELRL